MTWPPGVERSNRTSAAWALAQFERARDQRFRRFRNDLRRERDVDDFPSELPHTRERLGRRELGGGGTSERSHRW